MAGSGGRIVAVEAGIEPGEARLSLGVSGLLVFQGLVSQLFTTIRIAGAWAGDSSVRPDSFTFRSGVTTMVDAGSSGWRNVESFRATAIDRASTRVLALINIARNGMVSRDAEQADFDTGEVARLAPMHRDVFVGVKSAHFRSSA